MTFDDEKSFADDTENVCRVTVDGRTVSVPRGTLLIDACAAAGVVFPRPKADLFLKSEKYRDIYLVEVDGKKTFVYADDTVVGQDARIETQTPDLKYIRKKVAERLMKNHAPDCMTCEKAGDCFLQELRARYFVDDTSDIAVKPSEQPVGLCAFVMHHPSRCVGCGRCVSYLNEFAGTPELSLDAGGVRLLNPKGLTSEFSGNLSDVCPFGAMVSKIEKEGFRPWNLRSVQSVDLTDCVAADVRVDAADGQIARVSPDVKANMNDMWITNRARYSFDALSINRIDKPYVRRANGLEACSWREAAEAVALKLSDTKPEKIAARAGAYADCESMMALHDWLTSLGAKNFDVYGRSFYAEPDKTASWLFNTHIDNIARADALLMVGVDVRDDAALINVRLRQNPMPKALVGVPVDLTYPYTYLGNASDLLSDVENDKAAFCRVLEKAERPMMIVGEDALARGDGREVLGCCRRLAEKYDMVRHDWNGFNFLAHDIATLGALALDFVPACLPTPSSMEESEFVYLLTAEIPPEQTKGKFVVYQGVCAGETAACADVVLPSLSRFEKHACFVNLEGRARYTRPVVPPLNMAREDWKILRYLSEFTNSAVLPYDDLETVRDHLSGKNVIFYNGGDACFADWEPFGGDGALLEAPFVLKKTENKMYSKTMADAFKAEGGVL